MNRRRVDNFLAHYASKYYDPVKAREYYLKNRELKGREGADLSAESRQRQAEATSYVTNEINTKKQADLEANAAKREALSNAANAQAEAHKARMEKLQNDAAAVREEIVSKLKAHLDKLQGELKIPANASPKLRAFLEKQHAAQRNSALAKTSGELKKLRDSVMGSIDTARAQYDAFREGNTADRRAAAVERRTISETARKDLETEKKNIKEQVR